MSIGGRKRCLKSENDKKEKNQIYSDDNKVVSKQEENEL